MNQLKASGYFSKRHVIRSAIVLKSKFIQCIKQRYVVEKAPTPAPANKDRFTLAHKAAGWPSKGQRIVPMQKSDDSHQ
jgi:hypothetical protein